MEWGFFATLRSEGISFNTYIHLEHFLRLDSAPTWFVRGPVGGPWLQQNGNLPSSHLGCCGSLNHIITPVIGSYSSKVGGKKRCKAGGRTMSKSSEEIVFESGWGGDDVVVVIVVAFGMTWFPNRSGNNVKKWLEPWRLSGSSSSVNWVEESIRLVMVDIDAKTM